MLNQAQGTSQVRTMQALKPKTQIVQFTSDVFPIKMPLLLLKSTDSTE